MHDREMPTTIDDVIRTTQLYQDVELATAISQLKNNPSQLQAFLQNQQSTVYQKITQQKEDTFQKVYGDLQRATQVQEAVLMYNQRSKDLSQLQEEVYSTEKHKADSVVEDKQLAGRKSEMNEWTVNNKRDTLFVLSSLFIMLSGLLLFTGLWKVGVMSTTLWASLCLPLVLIFILIVVNRAQYTDQVRNQRYWNKKNTKAEEAAPAPSCASALDSTMVQAVQGAGMVSTAMMQQLQAAVTPSSPSP